jgi:predicted metal-dependent phosphoesterase TrpH
VVASREEAFDRYLAQGRPAYVRRYAADLTRMIGLVAGAGGVSVVAHPWGRGSRGVLDRETIAELAAAGLAGIEAGHQDHSPQARDDLRDLAANLGLVVTGSSDYHGTGKVGHDLGCHTTEPDQLARLLELAGRSAEKARAAGARPPALPSLPL